MQNKRLTSFVIIFLLLASFAVCVAARGQQTDSLAKVFSSIQSGQIEVVDMSHPLDEQSPYWPEGDAPSPFHARTAATYDHEGYFARNLEMPEHFGTHMDAPAHFDPKGLPVDQISPTLFLRPAIVVDVSESVKTNPDYRVGVEDLRAWEKAHGPIPAGYIVFFRTGWSSRWPSQKNYMNQDAQGVLHFPGLGIEAARYVLDHAHPVAIGIDTGSIDYGPSKTFEVHHLTMSAGLYHLENLANLEQLPATGAYIMALPMKLRGGSGSPTRVLALMPKMKNRKMETRK